MIRAILLVLSVAVAGGLHAASGPELPPLPDVVCDADGGIESCAERLVRLPKERADAKALIFGWNKAQHAAGNPGGLVPTLRELYGAGSETTIYGSGWSLPDAEEQYGERHWQELGELGFDLRRHPVYPRLSLLLVPAGQEQLAARIQGFANASWQESGHAQAIWTPADDAVVDEALSFGGAFKNLGRSSGLANMSLGNYIMIGIGLLLYWLAIVKGFEPLLLITIATGCIFVNAGGAGMGNAPTADSAGGILWYFFDGGIETGIFPLLIFLGVGALTDFGPLLANPWSAILGAAAQFGIFGSFFLAVVGWTLFYGDTMTPMQILREAGAIAIIGGADGPTSIYTAARLAPDLLGAIAVAAYSYMALVPVIQPPVMRFFTNDDERKIMMQQAKPVSKRARIVFPVVTTGLCILLLPDAVPLVGMLMFGNILRECGVADRLSKAAQNELINLVTIALGLSVGMKMSSDKFLDGKTLMILLLGVVAFVIGTAVGVLFGKAMCRMTGGKVNPLIGSAGVSAVPMAARVSQNEGAKYNRRNFLLMHAMGPNVAGVIGSAVAAGILISLLAK